MNSQLGVPALCSKYKSDDPNYHDYIPAITETPYFIGLLGITFCINSFLIAKFRAIQDPLIDV